MRRQNHTSPAPVAAGVPRPPRLRRIARRRFLTASALSCLTWAVGCGAPAPAKHAQPVASPLPTAQALREAAIEGRVDEVRRILAADPALVDAADTQGSTALIMAAGRHGRPFAVQVTQHAECVQTLLDSGADVNAVNRSGMTPLLAVASYALLPKALRVTLNGEPFAAVLDRVQFRSMQHILAKHPNVDAVDRHGRTPLYYAALAGRLAMARLLLDRGADKSIRATDGTTALDVAKRHGHDQVAALLDQ